MEEFFSNKTGTVMHIKECYDYIDHPKFFSLLSILKNICYTSIEYSQTIVRSQDLIEYAVSQYVREILIQQQEDE